MEYKNVTGFEGSKKAVNCMDKAMLNERFKMCDEEGIYSSCQPIYGFRRGDRHAGDIQWYIITNHILKILSSLEFDSLLDVGAAEGFTAYLAGKLFGGEVATSDFCEEVCLRSKEIFGMDATAADCCDLPFGDNEFDVVLSSESLEHIPDLPKAVDELLRVARKAVVITVPRESPELIEKNIAGRGTGSSHIHSFDLDSFNHLDYPVIATGFYSPSKILRVLAAVVEAAPRKHHENMKYPKALVDIYNAAIMPILRKLFGKRAASLLIKLDELFSKFTSSYNACSFVILKDGDITKEQTVKISPYWIMDVSMPYHYPDGEKDEGKGIKLA